MATHPRPISPGLPEAGRPPAAAERATNESLLDAGEELFAEQGIAPTSLRAITQHAGANLASVNYHFGGKEALIQAVLDRRLRPLNAERLRLLDLAERSAGNRLPRVEAVLEAFVLPTFTLGGSSARNIARTLGRVHFESDERILELVYRTFEDIFVRFTAAIARACPHLDQRTIQRRFYFSVGAMAMTVANAQRAETRIAGVPYDEAAWRSELIAYLAAGFRAPAAKATVKP